MTFSGEETQRPDEPVESVPRVEAIGALIRVRRCAPGERGRARWGIGRIERAARQVSLTAAYCMTSVFPESRSSGAIRSERAVAEVEPSESLVGSGDVVHCAGCDSGGEAGAHALLTVFYAIALEKYGPGPLLTPHCAGCRPNSR